MPKRKQNPEVCDATGLNSSNAAGYKKNPLLNVALIY